MISGLSPGECISLPHYGFQITLPQVQFLPQLCDMKMKKTSLNTTKVTDRKIKRLYLVAATVVAAAFVMAMPAFADDPLTTINNLSDFVFSAIKAIGAILLGFGIVQIGLALKGHDASQRAQGFMTFFGGVVIYFAKDILDMIL